MLGQRSYRKISVGKLWCSLKHTLQDTTFCSLIAALHQTSSQIIIDKRHYFLQIAIRWHIMLIWSLMFAHANIAIGKWSHYRML